METVESLLLLGAAILACGLAGLMTMGAVVWLAGSSRLHRARGEVFKVSMFAE